MKPLIALRKEQLDRLSEIALRDFQDRMVPWVRREFPDDFDRLGEEGVRFWVRSARDRALSYGMQTSVEVTGFLSLMLVLGEDFDTRYGNEWIAPILRSTGIPGGEKFRMILERELEST